MPKFIDKLLFLHKAILHTDASECLIWPFTKNDAGYGIISHQLVHRLVCIAVHGKQPKRRPLVAHSCGKGHLGCINPRHLRWASFRENAHDRLLHGTQPMGETSHAACLTEEIVQQIRAMSRENGLKPIADHFGISVNQVSRIRLRRSWKHVP